jgi:hypothetical protein
MGQGQAQLDGPKTKQMQSSGAALDPKPPVAMVARRAPLDGGFGGGGARRRAGVAPRAAAAGAPLQRGQRGVESRRGAQGPEGKGLQCHEAKRM